MSHKTGLWPVLCLWREYEISVCFAFRFGILLYLEIVFVNGGRIALTKFTFVGACLRSPFANAI